jgi:5-methylcytosine-specific restriction enzyme A
MPSDPLRPCLEPRCPNYVTRGRCPACTRAYDHHNDRFKRGATRYDNPRWTRIRDAFRAEERNAFCVNADKGVPGCTLTTDVVDHIIPQRGNEALMYDVNNLQPMCYTCHGRKTARETLCV